ncbi:MAG: radical SAM/SPASM domain-containing protein [Myxococcales bacterium]
MKALIDHFGYVPETCVWELTRACNLRCGHCGTSAGRRRACELSTAEAVDLARQLARLGNRLTTLSGGEPTLRDDWPVIARTLIDAGVIVNMVTNGQSNADELAHMAGEVGLANVAVSLDGLEETHDALRGRGAFDKATDTIRKLVARKIWVDVMFTVNRKNLGELVDVWKLTAQLGAQRFRVQLGKPMGNQTHRDDLTLRPQDLLDLLPTLGRLATRRGPELRIGDSIGYFSSDERVLRGRYCDQGHWTGCYAGVRAIGIQADGGIKGCLSLQPRADEEDRFIEGNVRDEPLEAIWTRPGAFAYNREFSLGNLKGSCAKCSHASLCRGGATCVAYAYSGEVGSDPMCYYQAAGLSGDAHQRIWPVSASAAAAALVMSLGACGGETSEEPKNPSTNTSASGGGSATPSVGGTGGQSSLTSTSVTVGLDYGVFEPTGGTSARTTTKSGTGGQTAIKTTRGTIAMDYGVFEPTGGTSARSSTRSGTGGITAHPDYGVISPSGGSSATSAQQSSTSSVDCSNVCCECDYGVPPEGCC